VRPGFDLDGKRVLVVGLARTGLVSALFSAAYGAKVTATDERPIPEVAEAAEKLRVAGVKLELGGFVPQTFLEQDLIVVSPGVPVDAPPLVQARALGETVIGEIELAAQFLPGPIVAITGSNGKTTTTTLIGEIMTAAGFRALVGGNIGTPAISLVERATPETAIVLEVSSFQLETIQKFRPKVAVVLNVTPDHLDRHESFEQYAAAKMRMFENQLERDFAILNADDAEVTRRMPSKPHIYWFSRQKRVAQGAFFVLGVVDKLHTGKALHKHESVSIMDAFPTDIGRAVQTGAKL